MNYRSDFQVLIVDDQNETRFILSKLLMKNNIKHFCACDGENAIKLLEMENIDLVITDYNMPIMNGLELIHEMARRKMENIPVVLMTADPKLFLKEISCKSPLFMTKPIENGSILSFIRFIHDQKA
jgi:CheY-like chemotaxis protein